VRSDGAELTSEFDLQPHAFLHVKQRFGVPFRIIDRVMRMPGLAQMLEVGARIFDEPLGCRALLFFLVMFRWCSRLDVHALAKDGIGADPAVDESTIVGDLELCIHDRVDEVKIIVPTDAAQNDVANT